MEYAEINELLEGKKYIKAYFYDQTFIYLIGCIPEEQKFVGTYLLCRDNARKYRVNPEEIKEVVLEEPEFPKS